METNTERPLNQSPVRVSSGCILVVNRGSSSVKFALYATSTPSNRLFSGKIERIGIPGTVIKITTAEGRTLSETLDTTDQKHSGTVITQILERLIAFEEVRAIGHRIVHGGIKHTQPARVTQTLLDDLHHISPYAPEHVPVEIDLIESFQKCHPKVPQFCCFDTAFHHSMPRVAKILPLPRRFDEKGIQRYGFHGISYAYLMEELVREAGESAAKGRVILAHLGNGCSMAAVGAGRCIDTSMGFTPTAGFPMSTRSGDLDPGLVCYLAEQEHLSAQQFHKLVNQESGLLGVSGISPDVRDLLAVEDKDLRAAEALALFCYQVRKWIGSFAAALGGVDTLVFSAGIGENRYDLRWRICEGLGFLGIELDSVKNNQNAAVISRDGSRVTVRVIRTDEELMIARTVSRMLLS